MKSLVLMSFSSVILLNSNAYPTYNLKQKGKVYQTDKIDQLAGYKSPEDKEFIEEARHVNAMANKVKHPKHHEHTNFGVALKNLGREGNEELYDDAIYIHDLAKKARHED